MLDVQCTSKELPSAGHGADTDRFDALRRRSQKSEEKSQGISAGEFFQVIAHFQYGGAAATVLENGGSAASVLATPRC